MVFTFCSGDTAKDVIPKSHTTISILSFAIDFTKMFSIFISLLMIVL